MNNAVLYHGNNSLQRKDALECLQDFAKEIKWKNDGDTIIDIGCGDGGTTSELKAFIPNNFKKIVGCDISEKMVQFANDKYATDFVTFTVLDIGSDLPEQFHEKFDHAFSFYALQWIIQQEIAFSNIYDLLSRGGDCLLMLMGRLPLYDVYRELARHPRWSCWMRDVERFVSPYHDSQDPEKDIKRMMTSIGFTKVEVKCLEKEFIYSSKEAFKRAMSAVNPFKIPLEMQEDFWEDYFKVVCDLKLADYAYIDEDKQFNMHYNYKTIVVYGRK